MMRKRIKKLTKEFLRSVGIFNPWQLTVEAPGVVKLDVKLYVDYNPCEHGMLSRSARWVVVRPGFNISSDGHWQDNGCKTFTIFGKENKQAKLAEAFMWVKNKYFPEIPVLEWERSPFGSWHPKGTLEALARLLHTHKLEEILEIKIPNEQSTGK